MGVIKLPGIELDSSAPKDTLYLLMQLMTQDVIGRGPAADLPDKSIRTVVRTRFLGRYIFDKTTQRWTYAQFSHESFQVLSNWMYAYQRHLLQKEKDLLPSPPKDRVNLYPSMPPERPEPKDD
jgi:glycerol-3-phosphate O-acyltransferase